MTASRSVYLQYQDTAAHYCSVLLAVYFSRAGAVIVIQSTAHRLVLTPPVTITAVLIVIQSKWSSWGQICAVVEMQDEGNTTNQCFLFFSIYILHTVTLNAAEWPVSRSWLSTSCGWTVNYCDSPETLKTDNILQPEASWRFVCIYRHAHWSLM